MIAPDEVSLLYNYLMVGAAVFALGIVGFVARRNLIVMFLSVEMMLQGVSISLVAWGRFHNDFGGQVLVLFVIAVAACEAAIGLALVLMLFRASGSLDVAIWHACREENLPEFLDSELPEFKVDEQEWPNLTPAGVQPDVDEEEQLYRHQV